MYAVFFTGWKPMPLLIRVGVDDVCGFLHRLEAYATFDLGCGWLMYAGFFTGWKPMPLWRIDYAGGLDGLVGVLFPVFGG